MWNHVEDIVSELEVVLRLAADDPRDLVNLERPHVHCAAVVLHARSSRVVVPGVRQAVFKLFQCVAVHIAKRSCDIDHQLVAVFCVLSFEF